jgi:hypothetical protein
MTPTGRSTFRWGLGVQDLRETFPRVFCCAATTACA